MNANVRGDAGENQGNIPRRMSYSEEKTMADGHELQRAIETLTGEIRLLRDELVRKDVYAADEARRADAYRALTREIEDMKREADDAARERRADRRVLYGALAASICTVIVSFFTQAGGVS